MQRCESAWHRELLPRLRINKIEKNRKRIKSKQSRQMKPPAAPPRVAGSHCRKAFESLSGGGEAAEEHKAQSQRHAKALATCHSPHHLPLLAHTRGMPCIIYPLNPMRPVPLFPSPHSPLAQRRYAGPSTLSPASTAVRCDGVLLLLHVAVAASSSPRSAFIVPVL